MFLKMRHTMMNIQNLLDITKGKENVNQNCNWDSTVELEVLKRQARNAGEDLVKKEPSHNVWNGISIDTGNHYRGSSKSHKKYNYHIV